MKKIIIFGSIFISLIIGSFIAVAEIKREIIGETKSYIEAKAIWGEHDFNAALFTTGDTALKARMAVNLLKNNTLKGHEIAGIKKIMGDHTGYFSNDHIPAYIINEGWKDGKDTWQLLLLPDKNNKVDKVVINKNCCDRK